MRKQLDTLLRLLVLVFSLLLLTSCTAGGEQFTGENPAGFWGGLWHGAISIITLLIHIFNDSVLVYEKNNTGGWYDFGFLLGVIFVWGGSCHIKYKSAVRKKRDKEWEEIGEKVEIKVMRKLKNWADDEEGTVKSETAVNKDEWDEICDKVEKKLKRNIREWAEKE